MTQDLHRRQSKWSNWEFWPAWLFNLPVVMMWLVQSLKRRDLFFFSRVNPDIETGGFFSEEKWKIYQRLPRQYLPTQILVSPNSPLDKIQAEMSHTSIQYPILVKPNIGERGLGIEVIHNDHQLNAYLQVASYHFIIQEFITHPLEMSVLAYRHPVSGQIEVTSVCLKEKLTLVGDGHSTLSELANQDYRSRIHWDRLKEKYNEKRILSTGEKLILEPIGNHSRGTTFLNGNELINPEFNRVVAMLFNEIQGDIQYGRFDIMYASLESFLSDRNMIIVEFNGVGSEPAHIYQPGYRLLDAYIDVWRNIDVIGLISKYQRKKGVESMSWSEFQHAVKKYRRNLKLVRRGSAQFHNFKESVDHPTFDHV